MELGGHFRWAWVSLWHSLGATWGALGDHLEATWVCLGGAWRQHVAQANSNATKATWQEPYKFSFCKVFEVGAC